MIIVKKKIESCVQSQASNIVVSHTQANTDMSHDVGNDNNNNNGNMNNTGMENSMM